MSGTRWTAVRRGGPLPRTEFRCSFCGKPREQVRSLVAGPTPAIAICDECVELCREIMDTERTKRQ
ncbi:MAG: hypothetical protein E6H91_15825 [Chloroflexi bacterium]|nr:MAG: hypothetical protein E6H91_15825 [Chloroflexota bacterium]